MRLLLLREFEIEVGVVIFDDLPQRLGAAIVEVRRVLPQPAERVSCGISQLPFWPHMPGPAPPIGVVKHSLVDVSVERRGMSIAAMRCAVELDVARQRQIGIIAPFRRGWRRQLNSFSSSADSLPCTRSGVRMTETFSRGPRNTTSPPICVSAT